MDIDENVLDFSKHNVLVYLLAFFFYESKMIQDVHLYHKMSISFFLFVV